MRKPANAKTKPKRMNYKTRIKQPAAASPNSKMESGLMSTSAIAPYELWEMNRSRRPDDLANWIEGEREVGNKQRSCVA